MSRFQNFDDFLKQEEEKYKSQVNDFVSYIVSARKANDEKIDTAFQVLLDFYKDVIEPRKQFIVATKKKEYSEKDLNEKKSIPYYLYRVNLTPPQSTWPRRMESYDRGDFVESGPTTEFDWHPNVAFQFNISLIDEKGEPKLLIEIRAWGKVPKTIENENVALTYKDEWEALSSKVTINAEKLSEEELEKELIEILKLCTSNILNHNEIIKGYPAF